jgi:hypothetical protein
MLPIRTWTASALVWPRRLLSLGSLASLALVSVACAPGSDADQARAVTAIEQLGGRLVRDAQRDGNPVVKADLAGTRVSDRDLESLRGLSQLHHVVLRGTGITDLGLPQVTTAGKLRNLELDGTAISDSGMPSIGRLISLRDLRLAGTRVSDEGLAQLRSLTKLWVLDLAGTDVSDAGLTHLRSLTALRSLDLRETRVTAAGVARLRKELPTTRICYQPEAQSIR